MIKNTTPYLGKVRLKFEKFPYYGGSSKLNKVHLNLGFTKLVSRIKPDMNDDGWVVNPECIDLIQKNTGLKVETYKFGPDNEYTLPNSCIHPNGDYVGSIEEGWWYYTNGLTAVKGTHRHTAWCAKDKRWIGYSHRASQSFGKGDMLFDQTWKLTDDLLPDYKRFYEPYLSDYFETLAQDKLDGVKEELSINEWAIGYIPFTLRGFKKIKTYEDAQVAAANFATYIS